jgi:hypothetical protein
MSKKISLELTEEQWKALLYHPASLNFKWLYAMKSLREEFEKKELKNE